MDLKKDKTDEIKDETTEAKKILAKNELVKSGYSEIVIDHWLNPRNLGKIQNYNGYSGKISSSCGDSMWVWLKIENGTVKNATFLSDICIGAVSAGSMMTEMIKGKEISKILTISDHDILRELGGLPAQYEHCAGLAQKTLKFAIADYNAYKAAPWKKLYEQK
ncbi:MAG: hypothetical protein AVO34_05865 [Firmicutes bacterium ML8_F2]|jgi:NifU-like protein involved in Fe-S cluster formation|nr:MAG: hypothetical protein AVO34_05865 [Firmicutes bacterium ML8_F2]